MEAVVGMESANRGVVEKEPRSRDNNDPLLARLGSSFAYLSLVVWWVLKIRPAAFELNVAQREYEAHWGLKPTQERCYINTIGLRAWRPGELVMRWKSRDGNGDGDDGGRIKDEG
jgi:hypothetical protein